MKIASNMILSSLLPAYCSSQNFTRMAMVARFSVFRRSGNQVFDGEPSQVVNPLKHTSPPGVPVLPPGGVTPPDPEKYGTFAARWLYSHRNVMYWLGIQSNVPDISQALSGS